MYPLIKNIAFHFLIYFLGISFWILFISYVLLTLPLYLYRWFVVKIVPILSKSYRTAVSLRSQIFASEFLKPNAIPRCFLVFGTLMDGHVTFEELFDTINSKWISRETTSGKPMFPELQQYPECWMGIMFWKQDEQFNLNNHLYLHELEESVNSQESQEYCSELVEELLNKPLTERRSPWEIHIIQNYKNHTTEDNLKKQSFVIFRMHHCLGDGYALLNLFLESCSKVVMGQNTHLLPTKMGLLSKLYSILSFPVQATFTVGRFVLIHLKKKTIYHIPDSKKSWYQFFARAPVIPVDKVKYIKKVFGVSFASVIHSSFAAALGKLLIPLTQGCGRKELKNVVIGRTAPMPNHPNNLVNHFAITFFEAPLDTEKPIHERIKLCEIRDRNITNMGSVLIFDFISKLFAGHLVKFTSFLTHNRGFPTIISNFSMNGIKMVWNGKDVLSVDVAVGGVIGVTGVVLASLGYNGKLHITATAEAAVMSKEQLNELLNLFCEEITIMYETAKEEEEKTVKLSQI